MAKIASQSKVQGASTMKYGNNQASLTQGVNFFLFACKFSECRGRDISYSIFMPRKNRGTLTWKLKHRAEFVREVQGAHIKLRPMGKCLITWKIRLCQKLGIDSQVSKRGFKK